jgi:nucleotide-binding universal stress UspA family protein
MIHLRQVLVPTDFSKCSSSALNYGAAFAEKFGASLTILHVVQNVTIVLPELGNIPPAGPPIDLMTTASQEALDHLIAERGLGRFQAKAVVRTGAAHQEIVELARDSEIDLIVMGTHGHTGLVHVLMGSVTEKVVRLAPCPVLTVRYPEHEFVRP